MYIDMYLCKCFYVSYIQDFFYFNLYFYNILIRLNCKLKGYKMNTKRTLFLHKIFPIKTLCLEIELFNLFPTK